VLFIASTARRQCPLKWPHSILLSWRAGTRCNPPHIVAAVCQRMHTRGGAINSGTSGDEFSPRCKDWASADVLQSVSQKPAADTRFHARTVDQWTLVHRFGNTPTAQGLAILDRAPPPLKYMHTACEVGPGDARLPATKSALLLTIVQFSA